MTTCSNTRGGISLAAVVFSLVLGGCMEPKLESAWLDRHIAIDGKAPEWAGREAYYDDREGLKAGFFNDTEHLYVYLSTWHRETQMQILTNGLTIWIDSGGGTKQTLGVNFPVRRPMPASSDSSRDLPSRRSRDRRIEPEMLKNLLDESSGEIRIIGAGEEPLISLSAADSSKAGIEAAVGLSNRTLIYELRMPLARVLGAPYAIQAGPGKIIGIGVKVGKREMAGKRGGNEAPQGMEEGPDGRGEGPGGTGGSPGGGGMGGFPGGGMGAPGGMDGRTPLQSLEVWMKVKLASGPAAAPAK